MTQRDAWTLVVILLYVVALEGAIAALIVIQQAQSGYYFQAAAYAKYMLAPIPLEVAMAGPVLALIASYRPSLFHRFALVAAIVFATVDTGLFLFFGFLGWFLVECGGSLFCYGGTLGS